MEQKTCWMQDWLCAENQFVAPAFRSLQNHGVQTMTQRFLQILGRTTSDDTLEIGGDILEARSDWRREEEERYQLAKLPLKLYGDSWIHHMVVRAAMTDQL